MPRNNASITFAALRTKSNKTRIETEDPLNPPAGDSAP